MMKKAIEVQNLSKVYSIYEKPALRLKDALGFSKTNHGRDFYALDHISFSVEKGKTLGIIGENGAGKSTLLKIITGVLSPTQGSIAINGKVSALLELGTGFNMEYTGIENIYLSGNINGLSKSAIEQKIHDILAFADIGDFAHQKVKTYSSGMFARLAFAVAVNIEPEIFIVDEALAVGDLFFQQKCNLYMKEKMKNSTILLVTHDMASVANMADEVLVLSGGKQVFYGKPLEAVEFYTKKVHSDLFQKETAVKGSQDKQQDQNQYKNQHASISHSGQEWTKVQEESLGGALDAKIESFFVQVAGEEYKGYVQEQDVVEIQMVIRTKKDIDNLIVGYQIKDKFGNIIFGENTHSSGFQETSIKKGKRYAVNIAFLWPQIQKNNYFLTLGLGEGHHELSHVIQCWAHNIFTFRNITNLPDHGLFNQKLDKFGITQIHE